MSIEQLKQAQRLRLAGFSLGALGHMYGLTKSEIKKVLTNV